MLYKTCFPEVLYVTSSSCVEAVLTQSLLNFINMQNKMENHDESIIDRFVLSEHHKKKFRDCRKDMKSVKKRNAFRRHTHENQVNFHKSITKYNVSHEMSCEVHVQKC